MKKLICALILLLCTSPLLAKSEYGIGKKEKMGVCNSDARGSQYIITNTSVADSCDASIAVGTEIAFCVCKEEAGIYAWTTLATYVGAGGGGGAPTDATYLLNTADGDLANAFTVADSLTVTWTWDGTEVTANAQDLGNCADCLGGDEIDESLLGSVPNADVATTADEFSADPGDCAAGTFATAIGTDGSLTCGYPPVVKCMTIDSPTDADNWLFFHAEVAGTVLAINCLVGAATSAVITVQECDANGANCGTTEAAMTCTTSTTGASGPIDNAAYEANDWFRIDVGTVTGSVGQVSVCVQFAGSTGDGA